MTAPEETEILKLSIKELTKKYNLVNNRYDQLRVKVLAILTIAVAGVTFIYSDLTKIVPTQKYGIFLFILGSILIAGALGVLLWLTSSVEWHSPVEVREIERAEKVYQNKLAYLRYIRDDYLVGFRGNAEILHKRSMWFNHVIYILVVGVIMVMAIKGGP